MNEIKVGQFVRLKIRGIYYIGKIVVDIAFYDNRYIFVSVKNKLEKDIVYEVDIYANDYVELKPKDNLEDLLEIGDIVHFKTLNGTGELIIKTEDRLKYFKESVCNKQMIITAIELHENRFKQKLGG